MEDILERIDIQNLLIETGSYAAVRFLEKAFLKRGREITIRSALEFLTADTVYQLFIEEFLENLLQDQGLPIEGILRVSLISKAVGVAALMSISRSIMGKKMEIKDFIENLITIGASDLLAAQF